MGEGEAMEHNWFALQKEFGDYQGNAELFDAFQEQTKIHESPATLVVQIVELEFFLKTEKKQRQKASKVFT